MLHKYAKYHRRYSSCGQKPALSFCFESPNSLKFFLYIDKFDKCTML
jgi:hypothetical protein